MTSTQTGGYPKGAKETSDKDGNRLYRVNFLNIDGGRDPLYIDDDEAKGVKIFKGKKLPADVAKKVVTEICRLLKKKQPNYYRKWCRGVTEAEQKRREQDLIKNRANPQALDLSLYPGFRFELVDVLNTTIDGNPRTYIYYGEQQRLTTPKNLKGTKLFNESVIIPIRKNMTLEQALVAHHIKSTKAKINYKRTGNLTKGRASTTSRAGTSHRKSSPSPTRRKASPTGASSSSPNGVGRASSAKRKLLKMSKGEVKRSCQNIWKVKDLDKMLKDLNLSTTGLKQDKCQRLQDYHFSHQSK
jgi:hypothetical protein